MSPDVKLKFEMKKKDRAEKRVRELTKNNDALKDQLIAALERKERPGTNDMQTKEIVSLRGRLAKGKAAYQAEVAHSDQLLIERGNYAAEVLSLKLELAESKKNVDKQQAQDSQIIAKLEGRVAELKHHNHTLVGRMCDVARKLIASQDTCKAQKAEIEERVDELVDYMTKQSEQSSKLRDLECELEAMTGRRDVLRGYSDDNISRIENLRLRVAEKDQIIASSKDELSEARAVIRSWVPIVESYAGRKMSKAEKAKWND